MKTLDFSSYEKLKIRPVKVSSLEFGIGDAIPAKNISISDLKPGYVCQTMEDDADEYEPNVMLYVDYDTVKNLFPKYPFACDAFIRPIIKVYNKARAGSYLAIDSYVGTWPNVIKCSSLTIVRGWILPEVPIINSFDDLFDLYNKYKLFDLCK